MRLEPISPLLPKPCGCGACGSLRTQHHPGEILPRHRHDGVFAAIVLSGTYVEAGDSGRYRVVPGDVLFHAPFESHLDRFDHSRAEVLNLPMPANWNGPVLGRLGDPESIARLAERDVMEAIEALAQAVVERVPVAEDWPDHLAAELLRDPDLSLAEWCDRAGLHRGSISRGFRQQFGITPARFRSVARTHRAVRRLADLRLSEAAAEAGFADQAHMSRATKDLTGLSPARLRAHLLD